MSKIVSIAQFKEEIKRRISHRQDVKTIVNDLVKRFDLTDNHKKQVKSLTKETKILFDAQRLIV